MQQFLHANAGLKSRFPLTLEFADYSVTELFQIGKMMMESRGFQFGEGVLPVLREYLEAEVKKTDANSGNGRLIRNIIEDIITRQSNRIITERKNGVSQSDEDLVTIKEEDIQLKKKDYSKFDLDEKLDRIIGLDTLKDELRKFRNKVLFDQAREKQGIKTYDDQSYHMMFKGNPGTGKTMMARIVAELLYEVGIISKNRVIETDRSGLVGKYIGETETKTKKVVESAFGGVLFIDEAYALNGNDAWDYGKKAMDTLIKMMEDHRSQLVVIMAGYTKEMEQLYQLNTGLRSRIAYEFEFPDYNLDELIAIAEKMYDDQHYVLDDDAKEILRIRLDDLRKRPHFGNARVVRQIVDKSIINLANRVSMEGDFTKEKMTHITYKDLGNID
jgi:SpoVK/Ycf46/Vps4 family AAA+-type ATPase